MIVIPARMKLDFSKIEKIPAYVEIEEKLKEEKKNKSKKKIKKKVVIVVDETDKSSII